MKDAKESTSKIDPRNTSELAESILKRFELQIEIVKAKRDVLQSKNSATEPSYFAAQRNSKLLQLDAELNQLNRSKGDFQGAVDARKVVSTDASPPAGMRKS